MAGMHRQIGVREDLLVSLIFASWNQMSSWLRQLARMQRVFPTVNISATS